MFHRGAVLLALLLFIAGVTHAGNGLVVHEWGTFTSLQDEAGNAIGGINTDDEPVPGFVHNVAPGMLLPTGDPHLVKSVAACHRDVTMRLETPVIYFYPETDFTGRLEVEVKFNGGWLTQYFPDAAATAPGISKEGFAPLTSSTTGTLTWTDLSLSQTGDGPATTDRVWTAPRQVKSATVQMKNEREKFLFYRGVGQLDAPLTVSRSGPELVITKKAADPGIHPLANGIDDLWLVDIRPDGTAAFRELHPDKDAPAFLIKTPASFAAEDYSAQSVAALRSTLHRALEQAGLYADEAEALLETWQFSYFKSPGLRLFFLVPRAWTDAYLPLRISTRDSAGNPRKLESEITRVMVGRIEIVTPEQRTLLTQIASAAAPDPARDPTWKLYLQLGRFRNALALDEQKRSPSPGLSAFIKGHGLEGYTPR